MFFVRVIFDTIKISSPLPKSFLYIKYCQKSKRATTPTKRVQTANPSMVLSKHVKS
jgi:hypothetical protein